MQEQTFDERMAIASAQGALCAMAREAGHDGEYDDALLAWLLTGIIVPTDDNEIIDWFE